MIKFLRVAELLGPVLLLATCSLAINTPVLRTIEPELQKAIDDFITDVYFPATQGSKLGLAIVRNTSGIVYTTGYGMANELQGIPNGNQTQFLIGSITKSFTATVVVKLLHERFPEMGEAVLDTPIMKLITSPINFTLSDRYRTEQFTFRDLLSHRTCIQRDDFQLLVEPFSTTSEVVYRGRYAEAACGFRSEFLYNNEMYVVAGEVAGILANKSYTQLVNELLQEIGMYNSSLLSRSDDFSKMPFRAQPYYVQNGTSYPMNPDLVKRVVVYNAAGGLFVTPDDMIKYMNFHLNKGNVDGRQIIPQNVMSWLTKPSIHLPDIAYRASEAGSFITGLGYGLGMGLALYDGWQFNNHAGYLAPYGTMFSLFPSQNLGIYTSSNEDDPNVNSQLVHMFIFELLRGTSIQNATERFGRLRRNLDAARMEQKRIQSEVLATHLQKPVGEPISCNTDIVGRYGSGISGNVEILVKWNSATNKTGLYIHYGKWGHGWMESVGGSLYKINWDTDIIQHYYAIGESPESFFAGVTNKTLQFFVPGLTKLEPWGNFTLGVTLDNLPTVPWNPNSC